MNYRIRVQGHLSFSWQERFEGLQITHEEAGTTLLSGSPPGPGRPLWSAAENSLVEPDLTLA